MRRKVINEVGVGGGGVYSPVRMKPTAVRKVNK